MDFATTKWGKILMKEYENELEVCIVELLGIKKQLSKFPELEKFQNTINEDIEKLQNIKLNLDSWDKTYIISQETKFDKWPLDKKVTIEQKEIAKEKRDKIKKRFNKIKDKILIYDSKEACCDIYSMYETLKLLKNIVIEFKNEFALKKQEKNIIDFTDIEHFALQILLEQDENGKFMPSKIAKKYQEIFEEIAIDEYQDSNLVQEYILNSISKNNNIFMVGDVKQSIYKFRQARPELFIKKYETYKLKEEKKENENLKIQLFKNFRSRRNILDVTNMIFESIMTKEIGDIIYNESEYLNLGANYIEPEDDCDYAGKTKINIINLEEKEDEDEELLEESEKVEDIVLEAKYVANEIQKLVKSNFKVYDKNEGYRNVKYKDIVVLLRSTKNLAPLYEKELNLLKIPVFCDTGADFLETTEIQTVMSILKIIDNPMQDIPLVTILRSPMFQFNDDELVTIKLNGTKKETQYFYEILVNAKENVEETLTNKINAFLEQIEQWRNKQEYLSIDELIWQIYIDTGYYNYVSLMTNGALRQANLKLLFNKAKEYEKVSFKGLFNFINFIDRLKQSSGDLESAKLIGENEDVVRIMSIHKSKGLEFPVVFLSGAGKQFNMQDLNESILLHQDIGIGPKYIDYERRIQYNTLAKLSIQYKTQIETLSEEMRILYVALTRAKEKLIITALSKNAKKELQEKEELLKTYNTKKVSKSIVAKYKTYKDWLELVYLNNKEKAQELIEFNIIEKNEINTNSKDIVKANDFNIESIFNNEKVDSKKQEEIKKILSWKYPGNADTQIPTKTSVTKLKQLENEKSDIQKETESIELASPKFLSKEVKITNAQKGTLIHLCIQKLDEKQEYTYEKMQSLVSKLVQDEIITENEAKSIDINKLLNYTKSSLWENLKKAKQIQKEQPFYLNIDANKIYKVETNKQILVQGIIDLYYVDENNKLILVDYKTDYVKVGEENKLKEKYNRQLGLYKAALEEALNTKVDKIYIYSVYLNKSIEI